MHDLATLAADVCGLEAAVIHLGKAGSDAEVASAEVASAEVASTEVASAQGSGSGATGKGGAVATEGTDGDNSAAADAAAASALFGSGVRAWLAAGGVAVVPYDKDEANHMPALRGGRTAHYLIVFGVAQGAIAACAGEEAGGGALLRLVCAHGLSRRPLVLTPAELLASNAQLEQMKAGLNTKSWVVKQGTGVRLARRVLLLTASRAPPLASPSAPEAVTEGEARALGPPELT